MYADKYQILAGRTLIDKPDFVVLDSEFMIIWNALGLAGESGEVVDLIKKGICHQHGLDYEALKKELGDVLWYVAALCTKLDFDMGEIMALNIEKLEKRYPDGYKASSSVKRADIQGKIEEIDQ